MSFTRFSLLFLVAICLCAQTPAPPKPAPSSPSGITLGPATPPITASAVPNDKVVLTVGDEKMTAGEFEEIVDTLPEQFRAAARGPSRRQFAEQLVRVKIMAQEARRQKLDQTPAVQRQLALQQENLLANALFQEMARNAKVDEAAAKQYFEQHKAEYESVHARHILIRVKGSTLPLQDGKKELTEEEALAKAQDIRKKIEAGEDFAALAKTESDDTGTAAKGGDLGTFRHGQMVPEFEKAAFTLPVGAVSEPVKTKFGYHLIQVQERDVKTFDQVRADIEKKIRPELARESMESLRKQVPVKMDDAFFGATTPPPPPPLQPVK